MLNKIFYNLAFSLLAGIFAIFCFSFVGFIFKIPVNSVYPVLGMLIVLVTNYICCKKDCLNLQKIILSYVILFISIFVFYFLSSTFYDYSYDGRAYHQAGIILLKNGYNPIYDTAQAFYDRNYDFKFDIQIFIDNYPKFMEIVAANIFALTDRVETGKILNYIIFMITFGYSFYIVDKYYKSKLSLLFAFLFCINPVVLSQLSIYYSDGLIYELFIISLFALIDITKAENIDYKPFMIMVMGLVMLSNIKFGGLLYAFGILLFGLFLMLKYKKSIKPFLISCLIIFGLIVVSGINPYFTNMKYGRHPLHPLVGNQKFDVMTINTPRQFINKSVPFTFFWSTFSKTNNFMNFNNERIELKLPFTFDKKQILLQSEDTRIAGFGIFWSGILLLSFISLFFINWKEDKLTNYILVFLLLTVLLNPINWWARYVPQFYAIPVFLILLLNKNNKFFNKSLISVLVLSLILNSISYLYSVIAGRVIPYLKISSQKSVNMLLDLEKSDCIVSDLEKLREKGIELNFK